MELCRVGKGRAPEKRRDVLDSGWIVGRALEGGGLGCVLEVLGGRGGGGGGVRGG